MSYGEFAAFVRKTAHAIVAEADVRGRRVAACLDDDTTLAAVACALPQLGSTNVLVCPRGHSGPVSADIVISDRTLPVAPHVTLVKLRSDELKQGPDQAAALAPAGGGDTSFSFLQSLQTGAAVIYTLSSNARQDRILQRMMLGSVAGIGRVLLAADIRQERGLSALFECLWSGGAVILSGERVENDLQPAGLYGASGLFLSSSWAPSYLAILGKKVNFAASLRSVTVAGAGFTRDMVDRIKRHLSNNVALHLDRHEIGTYAVCPHRNVDRAPIFRTAPGAEIRIVSEGYEQVPPRTLGALAIRSDFALQAESAGVTGKAMFRDGWFLPGISAATVAEDAFVLR